MNIIAKLKRANKLLQAIEFYSKESYDSYMKEHPAADPKNHSIKPQQNKNTIDDSNLSQRQKELVDNFLNYNDHENNNTSDIDELAKSYGINFEFENYGEDDGDDEYMVPVNYQFTPEIVDKVYKMIEDVALYCKNNNKDISNFENCLSDYGIFKSYSDYGICNTRSWDGSQGGDFQSIIDENWKMWRSMNSRNFPHNYADLIYNQDKNDDFAIGAKFVSEMYKHADKYNGHVYIDDTDVRFENLPKDAYKIIKNCNLGDKMYAAAWVEDMFPVVSKPETNIDLSKMSPELRKKFEEMDPEEQQAFLLWLKENK